MYRMIDKRDSGKTRKLLEECASNHGVFVCRHPNKVRDKCEAYGINYYDIVDVLGYDDYYLAKNDYGNLNPKYYIDELELFVQLKYLDGKLGGYSITNED